MKATSAALAQYAPAAISLFNNMKLPATILSGAMIPLGLIVPIPQDDEQDTKFSRALRRLYPIIAVSALSSELISVMWATVTVNQLTETNVEMAESVWHLLQRDFELPWAAVNAHFVLGMLGFMCLVGIRTFFMLKQGPLGSSVAGVAISALMLMVSIVNRAVDHGGGQDGQSYGHNIVGLIASYVGLMIKRAVGYSNVSPGPLELGGVAIFFLSICRALLFIRREMKEKTD